jgi:CRISPR-associated protein Cmx8
LAKTKTKSTVEKLTLEYKLSELPSSQHRAGLAGLVLIYQWLKRQQGEESFQKKLDNGAICEVKENAEGATIEINQAGIAALFDEIYAASSELTTENKIRLNKKKEEIPPTKIIEEDVIDKKTNLPKIDKKTGEVQKKITYCYPVAIPKGSFLVDPSYDKSSDDKNGLWIKLWRDVVWSILRGVPTTRKPYEARADGEYTEDAAKVWQELTQPETFTVDLPSTYFLGVQASNAENVPFKDRARYQLLLHFWSFACQIYVPQMIVLDRDKEAKKIVEKREFIGYAIAIPDVANLKKFCVKFDKLLKARGIEKSGYRPRDAVIDLPAESGLDLMSGLSDRITAMTGEQSTSSTVLGVDVIHTEKQGNNVRILSCIRIDPDEPTIDKYIKIKKDYWNPLFRRQRLINLIDDKPWYAGFDALLCTIPYEQSMENNSFQHDASEAFKNEVNQMSQTSPDTASKEIETLVFDLVKTYINRKLGSKYELKWSDIKDKSDEDKKNYGEKKEKIAKDAFLAIRSRTEQEDFINYFASTLCSVPQYMKPEDYSNLTKALYGDTDKIRTLTLLALSANS